MLQAVFAYLAENRAGYLAEIAQHLTLSAIAVCAALGVGLPLGVAGAFSERLYNAFSSLFGLLRVIPSLAILFVCIPVLGVGLLPAAVALTILAVPPILINTAAGFHGIDPAVAETAVGMGMSDKAVFFRVRLPLALPMVLTGIRTAAVEVIASATLAAYIGAGGLGDIIFTGLGLYRLDMLIVGGLSVAVLSLSADLLLSLLERAVTRYRRV